VPCSRATIYRQCLKFDYKYNMNFKTLKLYYKLCRPHYMFPPIWPSSGVQSYVKIALKTAALFHLCCHASRFRSIICEHSATGCYDTILFLSNVKVISSALSATDT
jgi:hypothetical protein